MLYIEDREVWQFVGSKTVMSKDEELAAVCWMCPDCNGDNKRDDLTYHKEEYKVCCFCGEVKRECFALWFYQSGLRQWHDRRVLPHHESTHYGQDAFWLLLQGQYNRRRRSAQPELDAAQRVLRILRGESL